MLDQDLLELVCSFAAVADVLKLRLCCRTFREDIAQNTAFWNRVKVVFTHYAIVSLEDPGVEIYRGPITIPRETLHLRIDTFKGLDVDRISNVKTLYVGTYASINAASILSKESWPALEMLTLTFRKTPTISVADRETLRVKFPALKLGQIYFSGSTALAYE